MFETGNGASLCVFCHGEAHVGFNHAPDLQEPLDTQGGEKLEAVAELYRYLAERSLIWPADRREVYYNLPGTLIDQFKAFQGFPVSKPLAGTPIQQAWWIWDCSPVSMVEALVRSNLL